MSLLLRLSLRRKLWISLTLGLSVLSIGITLGWNAHLSAMINAVGDARGVSRQMAAQTVVIMCLSACAAYTRSLCSSWTVETLAHDLRMGYARHFQRLPYPQLEQLNAGEQVSKLQNEMEDVTTYLRLQVFSMVDDLIGFIATLCWMLWLNPSLTLLSHLPVPIMMIYTAYASKRISETTRQSQSANAAMTGFADTLLTLFPIIKLFAAAPLLNRQYAQRLSQWEGATKREERRRALLMTLSGMLSCLPLLLLLWLGGMQVIRGTTQLGTLYVFINLSGNVSGVMMNMAGRLAAFRRFAVNMERIEPNIAMEENAHEHHVI